MLDPEVLPRHVPTAEIFERAAKVPANRHSGGRAHRAERVSPTCRLSAIPYSDQEEALARYL